MTILADFEIGSLCIPPVGIISAVGGKHSSTTTLTKEQMDEVIKTDPYNRDFTWREITDDEVKNWKPLISEYEPTLINTRLRPATDVETKEYIESIVYGNPHGLGDIKVHSDKSISIVEKIISYGQSSYGYDIRSGLDFKVFTNVNASIVDPKNLDPKSYQDVSVKRDGDYVIVPPNSLILGYSRERISMPQDVTAIVTGKSTYARAGLIALPTPIEAGWQGHVTLEFANTTPLPMKFYAGEGCCQLLFFSGSPCEVSYSTRNGKYQNQPAEVVLPKV